MNPIQSINAHGPSDNLRIHGSQVVTHRIFMDPDVGHQWIAKYQLKGNEFHISFARFKEKTTNALSSHLLR
jgi:hypothetical protein